jgi:hypothetical protein
MLDPDLVTRAELAASLRISERTLVQFMKKTPGISWYQIGRAVRFDQFQIGQIQRVLNPSAFPAETPIEVIPEEPPLAPARVPIARYKPFPIAGMWGALYRQAKRGAVIRNIPFELTPDDMFRIIERAKLTCEVSGHPMSTEKGTHGKRRPFAPSLDRIDSKLGYTFENCRLVCCWINLAIAEWGDDLFWKMVETSYRKRLQQT